MSTGIPNSTGSALTEAEKKAFREIYLNRFDSFYYSLNEGISPYNWKTRTKEYYTKNNDTLCIIGNFFSKKQKNKDTFVQFFIFKNINDQEETHLSLEELKDVYFTDYSGAEKNLMIDMYGEESVESICQICEIVKF